MYKSISSSNNNNYIDDDDIHNYNTNSIDDWHDIEMSTMRISSSKSTLSKKAKYITFKEEEL